MFGFIIALVGGFATPYLDAPVARPLAKLVSPLFTVEESEYRLLSFMVVLVAVGVLARLLLSGTTFWIAIGLVLGYFATRLVEGAQKLLANRRG